MFCGKYKRGAWLCLFCKKGFIRMQRTYIKIIHYGDVNSKEYKHRKRDFEKKVRNQFYRDYNEMADVIFDAVLPQIVNTWWNDKNLQQMYDQYTYISFEISKRLGKTVKPNGDYYRWGYEASKPNPIVLFYIASTGDKFEAWLHTERVDVKSLLRKNGPIEYEDLEEEFNND